MKLKTIIGLSILNLLLILGCQTVNPNIYINSDEIHSFKYRGMDIQYTDEGKGDTLLFIHGLGSSSYTWRYLKEYYKDINRVICIDLKGFGNSPKPINNEYMVEDQSDLVISFIKEKNLTDLTIIGNSYGGAVVLSTYLDAPIDIKSSIKSLVLLDPAAYEQKYPNYIALLRTPIINKLTLSLISKNLISKLVLQKIFHNDELITEEMIATYGSYLKGRDSHNALIRTAKNLISTDKNSFAFRYSKIEIPVLLIWGDMDNVIKLDIGERLNKEITTSTLRVIKNCGHVPQEEFPEETITIMNEFFSDKTLTKYIL